MNAKNCIFLCLILFTGSAAAIPISLNYSGSYVGSADTVGLFSPGDHVSGSYIFDSETAPVFPNPDFGVYDNGITALNVSIGDQTFGLNESLILPDELSFISTNQIFVSNNGGSSPDAPIDLIWFLAPIEQSILDEPLFSLMILQDFDATWLTSSALPTMLPAITEFEAISIGLAALVPFGESGVAFEIQYDFLLDSLTIGPVADVFEPASIILLLIAMGLLLARNRQRFLAF